jgi:uncharacterized protein
MGSIARSAPTGRGRSTPPRGQLLLQRHGQGGHQGTADGPERGHWVATGSSRTVPPAHAFYTALGFVTVGELGDDGLPEPCSSRSASDVVIGLATDAAVDELMRRAQDAGAKIVIEPGNQKMGIRRRLRRPRRPHVAGQPR